jgi:hypothetical protein
MARQHERRVGCLIRRSGPYVGPTSKGPPEGPRNPVSRTRTCVRLDPEFRGASVAAGAFVLHLVLPLLAHTRDPAGSACASVAEDHQLRRPLALDRDAYRSPLPEIRCRRALGRRQPRPARLGVPAVFVSRFVQTHIRVHRHNQTTQVELWEHPRPVYAAAAGRRAARRGRPPPAEPDGHASPRNASRSSPRSSRARTRSIRRPCASTTATASGWRRCTRGLT